MGLPTFMVPIGWVDIDCSSFDEKRLFVHWKHCKNICFSIFPVVDSLAVFVLMLQVPLVKAGKSNHLFIQHTYNKLLPQCPINLLDSFRTDE